MQSAHSFSNLSSGTPGAGKTLRADFRLVLNSADFCDWNGLLNFLKAEFAHTQGRVFPPSTVYQMTPGDVARRAAQEDLLLAFSGQTLAGCLFMKEVPDALFLGRFAISANHRGNGLARKMLDIAEARAHEKGVSRLILETRVSLSENQEKFMCLGFEITGSRCHEGFSVPTTLLMTKELRQP